MPLNRKKEFAEIGAFCEQLARDVDDKKREIDDNAKAMLATLITIITIVNNNKGSFDEGLETMKKIHTNLLIRLEQS